MLFSGGEIFKVDAYGKKNYSKKKMTHVAKRINKKKKGK